MRKLVLIAAMAIATPVLASQISTDTVLGATPDEVQANLKQMGYDIRKWEMEDGLIEVYAVMDGKRYEIYVDANTGRVARLKVK